MKKINFFAIFVIAVSIFLSSCGSPSSKKVIDKKTKTFSENSENVSIDTITNSDLAYRIYQLSSGNEEIAIAALAKWKELMLERISAITDSNVAYNFYQSNSDTNIRAAALTKWKELMLQKIEVITSSDLAYNFYESNLANKDIANAALAKYQELILKNKELVR